MVFTLTLDDGLDRRFGVLVADGGRTEMAAQQPITIYRGETKNITCTVYDEDGDPQNLSAYQLFMPVRRMVDDKTAVVMLSTGRSGITKLDQVTHTGQFVIELSPAILAGLEGEYKYDLWITDGTSNDLILAASPLIVRDAVYHPEIDEYEYEDEE